MLPLLTDFQQTLAGIQSSTSDDCVRILTETGDMLQDNREQIKKIRTALDVNAIELIKEARTVAYEVGPKLTSYPFPDDVANDVKELKALLQSEQLLDRLDHITTRTKSVTDTYRSTYCDLFDQRREAYIKAIEALKNRAEWEILAEETAHTILAPLEARLGGDEDRQGVDDGTSHGSATVAEMQSDLAAVEALKASALTQLQEAAMVKSDETVVKRVRMTTLFNRPIQSQQDLDTVLDELRNAIQKYLDEGAVIILE